MLYFDFILKKTAIILQLFIYLKINIYKKFKPLSKKFVLSIT